MEINDTILKAMVANLVDNIHGSTQGWTEEREVKMFSLAFGVSPIMAREILKVCDEVRETQNYDPI